MKITDLCIERPVFAWMLMAATMVFGGLAVSRMGVSQFPDVDFPTLNIQVGYEGAAPEIVEHDVVEPIEEALVQVEGIKSLTSTARQGSGNITLELDVNRDVDAALQEVQTRVAQIQNQLPRNIDPPTISKNNPEDNPILWIGVAGPFPRAMLADYARYRVKEKLQTVSGVGEISMGGYTPRAVRIWLDARKLAEQGLTTLEILNALRKEHVEVPAGRIETEGRELNVRVLGEAMELSTLEGIVLKSTAQGPVFLRDVALVEDGFEDLRRMSRIAGEPAQGLGIKKQRGANAVAVAKAVRAALDEIQEGLPEGMTVRVMFDSTHFIEQSVNEVAFELLMAVLLTGLLCWGFLGSFSTTLNVLLAIPMSLLGTCAVLYFLGYTFNTFTLLGLSLAVGIVVDDAIMVLENIVRHREGGADKVTAAREGTRQIAFAALSATIAVVAIFIPVIFMDGVIGKFFFQFGVTLSVAVLLSYVEAITLAPARCAQFLEVGHHRRTIIGRGVDRGFEALSRAYAWVLPRALKIPTTIIVVAFALFGWSIYEVKNLPKEVVPPQDQGRVMIRIQTAVGADIDEMDKLMLKAEGIVNAAPEVNRAFAVVGGFGGSGVNTGMMFVSFVPPDQREANQQELMGRLRGQLNSIPGVRAVILDLSQAGFAGGGRNFPVEFSIRGPDWEELVRLADQYKKDLGASGIVTDLDSDYQLGMPELRIVPDRARAADLGVSMDDIGTAVGSLVGGVRAGKYSTGGRRVDVRVRLLAEQRTRPEDLGGIYVRSKSGVLVPLSSLVTYEERPVLQSITRRDRERAISVFGNPTEGHAQGEALTLIADLSKNLPTGYRTVVGGASTAFKDSMSGLALAAILGLVFAYMVLASQFNSLLHPLTVLSILPLSMIGAVLAMRLTGHSLNVFSAIGLLLLLGIVKKNSIILVDYAATRVREGATRLDAVLEAGKVRLRPILMTSISTAAAAVPAALALGPGGEMRGPMAIAVIGGVTVSTVLSLVVVPAIFAHPAKSYQWLRRRFSR